MTSSQAWSSATGAGHHVTFRILGEQCSEPLVAEVGHALTDVTAGPRPAAVGARRDHLISSPKELGTLLRAVDDYWRLPDGRGPVTDDVGGPEGGAGLVLAHPVAGRGGIQACR